MKLPAAEDLYRLFKDLMDTILRYKEAIGVLSALVTIAVVLWRLWRPIKKMVLRVLGRPPEELEKFLDKVSVGWLRGSDLVKLNRRAENVLKSVIYGWRPEYVRIGDWHDAIIKGFRNNEAILVTGEAGLGKTRGSVESLRELMEGDERWRDSLIVFVRKRIEGDIRPPKKLGRMVLFFDDLDEYLGTIDNVIRLVIQIR